jgi:hypothetical protein
MGSWSLFLPKLASDFNPPASVSWVAGIIDVITMPGSYLFIFKWIILFLGIAPTFQNHADWNLFVNINAPRLVNSFDCNHTLAYQIVGRLTRPPPLSYTKSISKCGHSQALGTSHIACFCFPHSYSYSHIHKTTWLHKARTNSRWMLQKQRLRM